ncbi:hypothetical protein JTE90_008924 [Oedothorax gibbosus]|uniref:Uncharacterized protein n=1 Tax=Oedothorax gibbosus TaxID=931172 RepID=A0AAV6UPL6_9ARAC|nr:hypothetical protein JTE90_008924 [Oedothorax gibbosus]
MSKKVANPYGKVTSDEVYNGLTSINYLEKTHKEMLTHLKNTKPYKALMQMADDTYLNPSNAPFPDVQSTKEKIKEVGSLVLDLDYCISNALVKAVNLESKCVVETFIKRVSNMKQIETEPSPSPKKGKKRPACSNTLMKSQDSSDAKQIKGPVVNSHESLPKRIRKPNSKYTSIDE